MLYLRRGVYIGVGVWMEERLDWDSLICHGNSE